MTRTAPKLRANGKRLYTIYMQPGLRAAIETARVADGRSATNWLTRAVVAYLDAYDATAYDDGTGDAKYTLEFPAELVERIHDVAAGVSAPTRFGS
jgi:hypothetical protein